MFNDFSERWLVRTCASMPVSKYQGNLQKDLAVLSKSKVSVFWRYLDLDFFLFWQNEKIEKLSCRISDTFRKKSLSVG